MRVLLLLSLSPSLYLFLRSIRFVLFASLRLSPSSITAISLQRDLRLSHSSVLSFFPTSLASLVLSVAYLDASRSFVVQQVIFFHGGISSSRFSTPNRLLPFSPFFRFLFSLGRYAGRSSFCRGTCFRFVEDNDEVLSLRSYND